MPSLSRLARVFASLVALAAGATRALALDPDRAASQYVVTKWGATSLHSHTVHALHQTRDGYLWVGTSAGVLRYDGARFVAFDAWTAPSLADGGVSSLSEGQDGTLFLGTASGTVVEYREGAFRRLPLSAGSGLVYALLSASDGSLWIGRLGHPAERWADGVSSSFDSETRTTSLRAMAQDRLGQVWLGTWNGLVRHRDGAFEPWPLTSDTVQALHVDRAGALWVGTPHGLYRWHEGRAEHFSTRDGLSHDNVSALLEDRDGNLWIGTARGGLNRRTGGRFSALRAAQGLTDDDVRSLLEDREGNLWVGTADGLNCISDGRFITYGRLEGLHDVAVTATAEAGDGSVWVGTGSGEIARVRSTGIEHWRLPSGVGWEGITSLYSARDGSLWICVDNGRLFRLRDGRLDELTPEDTDPHRKVRAVMEDEHGVLFLVPSFGLARIRERRLVAVHPEVAVLTYLHAAHWGRDGTLWVGGSRGLARLKDGAWRVFTTADGLPHERVRAVSEDEDGSLWIATGRGLAHLQGDTIRSVRAEQGLPEHYLRLLIDDGLGHLWVAGTGHLFRLEKRQLRELFAGTRPTLAPVRFDASDGLRTTEAALSNSPGFRARDGRLWFATAKGVSMIDPRRIASAPAAAPARIESVVVDGEATRAEEYPPGRGEVSIDYTALAFQGSPKIRFRYQLEGFDRDWVQAGARRSAYYSGLAPGKYRFQVMASSADGVWNSPPTSFSFRLQPPFTQTPVFYLLCAAGVATGFLAAHRLRVGQMRARFGVIMQERMRIARELHDILAQGLVAVSLQIDQANDGLTQGRETAPRHLQMAKALVKSSLAEVRRSIWILRAQTAGSDEGRGASLSESLARLAAEAPVPAQFTVTGAARALAPALERNVLRIAHEAVTNVGRHAGAKALSIELDFGAEALRLTVKDDGRGFEADEKIGLGGDHFGLVGMIERARSLGGELRVVSRPGAGTEIVCGLPYRSRVSETETGEEEDGAAV